jgi:uncharacterized SAM-binding protein YcdF (DUF218 family)
VLGGGSATFRARGEQVDLPTPQSALAALEGARLHRLMPTALVIVSGGRPLPDRQLAPESAALRDVLIRLGVTPDRIVEESQSRTTHEQAINMGPLLKRHQVQRFVLVATPLHMWRAVRMFRREGLDPIPAPAAVESEPLRNARNNWLPSASALRVSEAALYHYFAIVYARVQGWL